jgi:FAD/FMN-containing dehydrogenase
MRVRQVFAPYEAGHYLNFTEQTATPDAFFDAATIRRLRALKAGVDPQNLFMANHQIDPERLPSTS